MPIYRAVAPDNDITNQLLFSKNTRRHPGNVPFLVDNLWEWKRPERMPCRRTSVFATPVRERATMQARAAIHRTYQVEFSGGYKLCQLAIHEDSKCHPDCKDLPELLFGQLGQEWIDADLLSKTEIGRLWIPCLDKNEVESIFAESARLASIRNQVFAAITYWDDILLIDDVAVPCALNNTGEVFFEAADDGYYLRDVNDLPGLTVSP
ncbi:MAG: hypothetical protein HGA96_04275 [Desulfobulbaceae bacterium]|nr:hypothetical protein [Desulfobulbaceae bacterium]